MNAKFGTGKKLNKNYLVLFSLGLIGLLLSISLIFGKFYFAGSYTVASEKPNSALNLTVFSVFSISGPGISKTFNKQDLLNFKSLRSIEVSQDPAYQNLKRTYLAVPLSDLFAEIPMESISTMSFKCLDGFSGGISKARALNRDTNGAMAYLAIEPDQQKWPVLASGKNATAGPFYLIWDHPEKSKIMTEEWPYQLAGLELSDVPFEAQYPNTIPDKNLPPAESTLVLQGHKLFMTNCFVCHSLNGDGAPKIGPDLNIPYSPSEYLQFKYFATLVRNPQNLRKWDQARMPGFAPTSLDDTDLKNIWLYLTHMAERKIKH